MSGIFDKFHELGERREQKALESLMNSLDNNELINLVKENLSSSKFIETWDHILNSFQNTTDSHTKRLKLIIGLLDEFEQRDITQSRIDTIMKCLNYELPKFQSPDLAKLCNWCLEQVQSKKNIKFVWKDLLPEVLNVLIERDTFTYDELDFTGAEYKSDFINSLCMSSWSPSIVTSLTTVLTDMPITKEEHLKIVTKLGTYIEKLTPQEIPSFVYQLLRFCKPYNCRSVLLKLQNYFELRIYNTKINDEDSPDSNSVLFDVIESTDNRDMIDAESTVLYHIHSAASSMYDCIKDYLNALENMVRAPEFILHPFQLMVLFTISSIPHYEETVYNIIRASIVKTYNEEMRKEHSCWYREMVPIGQNPTDVLSKVIHYSVDERDLVVSGLVNFAFVLLGIGAALGRDIIAEKQWKLGNLILLKIIKRRRSIVLSILQTLSGHIGTRHSVSQYIECLYILTRTMPLLMLENRSSIIEMIDRLMDVSSVTSNQLLDALIPLVKVSGSIRDHLIIYLRKALHSRSADTRQMAVNGFLKLITNLKISNMAAFSQNSGGSFSSGHSVFTQISLSKSTLNVSNSNFSNEGLCMEILSILKRSFMQQAEIRVQLYDGLYDAVCLNPELAIPVLDIIFFHFNKYITMDEDQLPPVNFDKLTMLRENQMVLEEPFGKLVHTVGLIITKINESDEDKENNTVLQFTNILDSLSQRMSNCELVHFELDDGTNLLDIIPESQKKMLILKEAMCIYEALVGYKIYSWEKSSEKQGHVVNNLFQGYSRLLHFSKTLSKPKKADSKKRKLDQTKTTQETQSQTVLKKETHKLSKHFKLPDTVWTFQTVKKALILLHEPKVSWTTVTEANIVKTKKELHQHVMQAAISLVQNVKRRKDLESHIKKMFFDHITEVASVIYKRIISRLNEFIDFDSLTAILAMECFNLILLLINTQFKSNIESFLNKLISDTEKYNLIDSLTKVVNTYENIFANEDYELADDLELKKLSSIAINTLNNLITHIPTESNTLSLQLLDWLKNFAYNNSLNSKNSTAFINVFLETDIRFKDNLKLFENISIGLGDTIGVITEEEHTKDNLQIINEATVFNILLSLCNTLKSVLDNVDALILRLKSEYFLLNSPGEGQSEKRRDSLKMKEIGVCCQLCFVITILTNLSNLLIPSGNLTDAIFKCIKSLFCSLSSLTKYFNTRSSKINLVFQSARFERVVKLAGKQLAPTIYKFILHLDESQKESTQATQQKKKNINASTLKSKVLKETRLIPKVVYEIEQFSKCVIQLSNKTKVDLSKYVGQGTVRDFRIMHLDQALEQREDDEGETETLDEPSIVLEDSTNDSSEIKENTDNSDESTTPPSKKTKR